MVLENPNSHANEKTQLSKIDFNDRKWQVEIQSTGKKVESSKMTKFELQNHDIMILIWSIVGCWMPLYEGRSITNI